MLHQHYVFAQFLYRTQNNILTPLGFGACCYLTHRECGGTVKNNCTHIQNAEYPNTMRKAETCTWTIPKLNSDVCFIRLDFEDVEVFGAYADGVNNGECTLDSLSFV